jgi:hypothetical protein
LVVGLRGLSLRRNCLAAMVPAEHEDGYVVAGGVVSYQRAHDRGARVLRRRLGRAAAAGSCGDLLVQDCGDFVYAVVD